MPGTRRGHRLPERTRRRHGWPAQPEELAPAHVFLAAPSCAGYISGAVLPVMGGPTS